MNIGIIDADLIGKQKHNFPNLACMKLSGYYKQQGHNVQLLCNWMMIPLYDKVFVSKVFTDTVVDENWINYPNVSIGGTGFFYDKAENLQEEIQHHMPDYHLYDDFVKNYSKNAGRYIRIGLSNYTDYSIGYLTRGCFRKCPFCVNKKYDRAFIASPLNQFLDESRKKICLLDDNFLSHPEWKRMLLQLQDTGKPFLFKQGLDERLLTEQKCKILFKSRYDGDYTFAFDNIEDYKLINDKLKLIREFYSGSAIKFYVLMGFDRNNCYDESFWKEDIIGLLKRMQLLSSYKALPYVMRHMDYLKAPKHIQCLYNMIRRWGNCVPLFKKTTLIQSFAKTPLPHHEQALKWMNENIPDELFNFRW